MIFSISASTVTSDEEMTFQRIVTRFNEELHKKYKSLQLSCVSNGGTSYWNCIGNGQRSFKGESLLYIYQQAAKATAELVLEIKEQHIIRSLIRNEFKFSEKEDCEQIVQHCIAQLEKGTDSWNPSWNRRFLMLAKSLQKCLLENNELNIDGFVSFRLQEYGKELREVVEYSVDEFLVDQQYEEFVGLLKYYVYFQQPQIPMAHVVYTGGRELLLFDEKMNPLECNNDESVFLERINQQDMEMEDAVVNTLISVSPAKLVIHTRDVQMPVIQTIIHIFEKRVKICHYCPKCHAFFKEKEKI
ncbi:putative sporulation protein YtxC [Paenibacillus sp. CMAA1364]